ncbi:DUF309 domain-containing protein [Sneathiella limimaris]|uniref:DUF309 domain-containing protein n=1 Tax=Sneathiella limimaris TaxID=1964213 RepID=UPI00146A7031|nr:DUF309 domain-containing protein [Sneathiella limimaris]
MTGRFPHPPHAHVPGGNARHAEAVFSPYRSDLEPENRSSDLAATNSFRAGLQWLEDGYYWEAHELLEMVWGQCAPNSAEKKQVQALIQLANAGLKLKMGRPAAVLKILKLASDAWTEAEQRGAGLLSAEESDRLLGFLRELELKVGENAL